jgi:hypothetical protein
MAPMAKADKNLSRMLVRMIVPDCYIDFDTNFIRSDDVMKTYRTRQYLELLMLVTSTQRRWSVDKISTC